ncbi:amidohydrolase [Halioglobus maricola]|nr:amidohydrolase [Halioglobus maricola]
MASQQAGKGGLSPELYSRAGEIIEADSPRITEIFKDIHQHPELGFAEVRTAGIVAKELTSLGFDVQTGIGKTGVLAILRNGKGPTVLYRADMDANAVKETADLPYASTTEVTLADGKVVPVSHMCGHDANVSWMLAMAHAMVELKDQWRGTLVIVGQPAEELIAGAAAMIEDGLYSRFGMPRPDYLIGQHTAPIPVGAVMAVDGVRSTGTDQLDVTFYGVGGHGSMPQHTIDPVLMASSAVVQYQSIISRNIDPQQPAVLTVGSIQSGSDNNVIPDKAILKINLRWFSESVREQLISGIKSINRSIAVANGVPESRMPTMRMKGHTTPMVNDPALTARLATSFKDLKNIQVIEKAPPAMASEDVHLLLGEYTDVPFSYTLIGVVSPKAFADAGFKPPYFNHNGDFLVELGAMPIGSLTATIAALELLGI